MANVWQYASLCSKASAGVPCETWPTANQPVARWSPTEASAIEDCDLLEPALQASGYFPATLALVGRWTSVISPIISQTRMIPQDISNSYHLCP